MIASIDHAIELINDAGGVGGEPVDYIVVDEGASLAAAIIGYDTLIARGVDAIVGPLSSISALGGLNRSVSAGVLNCSPSASAMSLDTYPANGLLVRTIASDSLQAQAIARQAEQTGGSAVAILAVDDVFGRPYAAAVRADLEARGLDVVHAGAFRSVDVNLQTVVADALATAPDVLIILGDSESLAVLTETLATTDSASVPAQIIANDALGGLSESAIRSLPPLLRARLTGVVPALSGTLEETDPVELESPFAAHAFDCVNLIALAAERAGVDDPARVAAQLAEVSSGGAVCRNYATCRTRLTEGLQIDYSGRSGPVDLTVDSGRVSRARFEQFTFDSDGQDVVVSAFDIAAR
jgi:branched-chain amino acid transport system substrate-binding protein